LQLSGPRDLASGRNLQPQFVVVERSAHAAEEPDVADQQEDNRRQQDAGENLVIADELEHVGKSFGDCGKA